MSFIIFRPNLRWGYHLSYQLELSPGSVQCTQCEEEEVQTTNLSFLGYGSLCMGGPFAVYEITWKHKAKAISAPTLFNPSVTLGIVICCLNSLPIFKNKNRLVMEF